MDAEEFSVREFSVREFSVREFSVMEFSVMDAEEFSVEEFSVAAAALGRRRWVGVSAEERQELCSRAGKASANSMTRRQRSARARKAALARWERAKKRAH